MCSAVIDHIQKTKQKKLDTWGPQLGANGPTTVVVPQPLTANNLTVDGERLDVKAKDSAELIATMKNRYPNAGLEVALTIGAKVNKGEMKW